MSMMKRIIISAILSLGLLILFTACGPNQRILESANENQGSGEPIAVNADGKIAPAVSSFEQDLNAMRTADFKFILVFRRKDGHPMDAADKELISKNTGQQANRRRLSDEGKAIIIGSNFPFLPALFKELTERFKMEDHSKPDSGPVVSNTMPNP